jgi:hypothetical protein
MSGPEVKEQLGLLKTKRIYVGHQSVGSNILQGLASLMAEDSTERLTVLHMEDHPEIPPAFLAEQHIGVNGNPPSKCSEFERVLTGMLKDRVDIALMKFCYVDITGATDVDSLLGLYCTMVDSLRLHAPRVRLVHVTVPLTFAPALWKQWVGRILGRTTSSEAANVKRNLYNTLLRERFAGEPIFDLAAVESTYPDGSRETFTAGGKKYFALIPSYSGDGTHLNAEGGRRAARALVAALAEAAR